MHLPTNKMIFKTNVKYIFFLQANLFYEVSSETKCLIISMQLLFQDDKKKRYIVCTKEQRVTQTYQL